MLQLNNIDLVYFYAKHGIDSDAEITDDVKYSALYISILSYRKNCKFINNIYIVGDDPGFKSDNVFWIPCKDKYKNGEQYPKDANLSYKIYYATKNIEKLSDNFLVSGDDSIVVKESSWDDFYLRYHNLYRQCINSDEELLKFYDYSYNISLNDLSNGIKHPFGLSAYDAVKYFYKLNGFAYHFEPHIPFLINRTKFIEYYESIPIGILETFCFQNGYLNFAKIHAGQRNDDDILYMGRKTTKFNDRNKLRIENLLLGKSHRFLNAHSMFNNRGFCKRLLKEFEPKKLKNDIDNKLIVNHDEKQSFSSSHSLKSATLALLNNIYKNREAIINPSFGNGKTNW